MIFEWWACNLSYEECPTDKQGKMTSDMPPGMPAKNFAVLNYDDCVMEAAQKKVVQELQESNFQYRRSRQQPDLAIDSSIGSGLRLTLAQSSPLIPSSGSVIALHQFAPSSPQLPLHLYLPCNQLPCDNAGGGRFGPSLLSAQQTASASITTAFPADPAQNGLFSIH
uniref:Uncharacterized protein n=1 Tax=Salix viminalis TaxID=40686 RepID=A0A6N2LCS7_SALVM